MTIKNFSPIVLLLAIFATASTVNAEIISNFDASSELPEPGTTGNANDSTASTINTAAGSTPVTNRFYNTRSTEIGGDISPHLSGVVPSISTANNDGLLYVDSRATASNTSINQLASAYHEFSIEVTEDQLDLDTLSYNYWATEATINDAESDTDFFYETRALASLNSNETDDFSNLGVTETSGARVLNIQNPASDDSARGTSRDNVVEFDLSAFEDLSVGDELFFRLAFSDYGPENALGERTAGPNDSAHIHRLDNVQIASATAIPEPSAICLMVSSFGLLGLRRRR